MCTLKVQQLEGYKYEKENWMIKLYLLSQVCDKLMWQVKFM